MNSEEEIYKYFNDESIPVEEKIIFVLEKQKKLFQSITRCMEWVDNPLYSKEMKEGILGSLDSLKYINTVLQRWLLLRLPDPTKKFIVN